MNKENVRPLYNKVLVHNMLKGERKVGKIVIANDDGKTHGIRPRWAEVYAVGPDVKTLKVGHWVLIEHGRWTRELKLPQCNDIKGDLRCIEYPAGVILVADEEPKDETVLDSMTYGERTLPSF